MITVGVILLIIGIVTAIPLLTTVGVILAVAGAVMSDVLVFVGPTLEE